MNKKLKDIIQESKKYITEELSFEEIKWLLKDIFSLEEYELIAKSNDIFDDEKFMTLLKKANDVPVSYLLGYQDFYGYRYQVNKNVLIPRNETEELINYCLEYIKKNNYKKIKILEIGTGSGCICITLNKELNKLNIDNEITSCDISNEALKVAKQNALILNSNINFIESDVFSNLINYDYDLIISNPPYIEKNEFVSKRVLNNEPHIALFSDETGLEIYKKIFSQINKFINLKALFFEISPCIEQGLELLKNKYCPNFNSQYKKDINGFIRFAIYLKD
ncbi:MAG: peptide chain release factor N(5)-glutamine methyltransferase [Bacilli bacterium]|mgnify:FL=1